METEHFFKIPQITFSGVVSCLIVISNDLVLSLKSDISKGTRSLAIKKKILGEPHPLFLQLIVNTLLARLKNNFENANK